LAKALKVAHTSTLERAARTLEVHRASERHVSTMTFAIPSSRYEEIRGRLVELERELLAAAAFDERPDRVYQVAIALFPVSKLTRW
jgi:uncharacterized protein (TIGR02147 family)